MWVVSQDHYLLLLLDELLFPELLLLLDELPSRRASAEARPPSLATRCRVSLSAEARPRFELLSLFPP